MFVVELLSLLFIPAHATFISRSDGSVRSSGVLLAQDGILLADGSMLCSTLRCECFEIGGVKFVFSCRRQRINSPLQLFPCHSGLSRRLFRLFTRFNARTRGWFSGFGAIRAHCRGWLSLKKSIVSFTAGIDSDCNFSRLL